VVRVIVVVSLAGGAVGGEAAGFGASDDVEFWFGPLDDGGRAGVGATVGVVVGVGAGESVVGGGSGARCGPKRGPRYF